MTLLLLLLSSLLTLSSTLPFISYFCYENILTYSDFVFFIGSSSIFCVSLWCESFIGSFYLGLAESKLFLNGIWGFLDNDFAPNSLLGHLELEMLSISFLIESA